MKRFLLIGLFFSVAFSGCIRIQAGTWHKDADQNVDVRQVGIDTSKLLPGQQNQPRLTVGDES